MANERRRPWSSPLDGDSAGDPGMYWWELDRTVVVVTSHSPGESSGELH